MITRIAGTNTDPSSPADYNATIMSWVTQRLAALLALAAGATWHSRRRSESRRGDL